MPEILSPNSSDGIKPAAKTADDINDLFKSLDDDKIIKDDIKEEPKKAKETDDTEEESDELELIESDEEVEKLDLNEQAEDLNIDAPPRKKEILKKYPELFKDFPFMEKMLFRDKAYNELFGSFDDAKEAAEHAENFKGFETQLLAGNTREILKNVKEADEKAFNIIVDDYLPTLAEIDKEAYFHVVGNLNKRLIMEMVKEANETGNEDLKQAALFVNQFVFGSSKFTAPQDRVDKTVDEKSSQIEQERLQYVQERFESSRDELQSKVDNTLKVTISEYIDPKGAMTPYVKKNAVADALKILTSSIANDPAVPKTLDKLWRVAFDAKFSKDSLDKIQRYYLGRARSGLRNAILKARTEALKDLSTRLKDEEETDDEVIKTPQKRGLVSPGRTSQPKSKNEMKRGESVADFFARD